FNDTATTEIYTLSLHDALPISWLLFAWPKSHSPLARAVLPSAGFPHYPEGGPAVSRSDRSRSTRRPSRSRRPRPAEISSLKERGNEMLQDPDEEAWAALNPFSSAPSLLVWILQHLVAALF